MSAQTFKRHEKKYLLNWEQFVFVHKRLMARTRQDEYGLHTICSLYYDTPGNRALQQKGGPYKEKLRLRSYGVPAAEDTVFLELKKKYEGVSHKRRMALTLAEAKAYLNNGTVPENAGQVFGEIDFFVSQFKPEPKTVICYNRTALVGREDPGLRITFDNNIRYRVQELDLARGDWGDKILDGGDVMMEIKLTGAIPCWLAGILSDSEVYPRSFSKYGNAYEDMRARSRMGGEVCRHAG